MLIEEEKEIIRRVLRGETEAYRLLVEAFQDQVYRLVLRSVADPHEAEEIAQIAFVKAYETLSRFKGRSSFGTYVIRIALSEAVDHLRRRGRTIGLGVVDELTEELLRQGADPAEQGELRERIKQALESLPHQQRGAFLLHGVEGLNHREAGLLLGCTEGAVKAHYFHALRKLRRSLLDLWRDHLKEKKVREQA